MYIYREIVTSEGALNISHKGDILHSFTIAISPIYFFILCCNKRHKNHEIWEGIHSTNGA